MKNRAYIAIAFFLMLLGTARAGVQAQISSKVQVNIPFEFKVGNEALEPGVYTIKQTSPTLLLLRNTDGTSVILNAPLSLQSKDKGERLVFGKVGNEYVLTEVWLNGESGRRLLPHHEKRAPAEVSIRLR